MKATHTLLEGVLNIYTYRDLEGVVVDLGKRERERDLNAMV